MTLLERDLDAPFSSPRLRTSEHVLAGAQWRFSSWSPARDLEPLVASMWESRGTTQWSSERLLPTGTVDVVINLGTAAFLVDGDSPERKERFAGAFVSGLQSEPLVLETAGSTHTIGVALHAYRAAAVFGVPMHELAHRVTHINDLFRDAATLREDLLEAATPAARFELLERWLRRRVERGRAPDAGTIWAADLIHR